MKSYIRDNNTRFRLNDVHDLGLEYMAAVDEELATSSFSYVLKHEEVFKAADAYVEEALEPLLQVDDFSDKTDMESDDESF